MLKKIESSFLFLLCLVALASCSARLSPSHKRKTLSETPYVENMGDRYMLYAPTLRNDSIKITALSGEGLPFVKQKNLVNDSTLILKKASERPFFHLISTNGDDLVSNRRIYFKKEVNFRDIGGISTNDGRTVTWGKIFRSDNLSKLKSSEFSKFEDLKIKKVFDLRTKAEIHGKEDHLPQTVAYENLPTVADNGDLIAKMREKIIKGQVSGPQADGMMIDLYKSAVTENVGSLKKLINEILDADAPVLYHCSAGKDRTGITTAILLSILNVDRRTIIDEFMMSNYYRNLKTEKMLRRAHILKIIKPHVGLDAIAVLMSVEEKYLLATFATIDQQYGNMDQFISQGLGIDPQKRALAIQKFTY